MSGSFLFSYQKTKDGEHLSNRIIQYNILYKPWTQEVLELQATAALEILLENVPVHFSCPLERMLGGMVPMSDPAQLSHGPTFTFFPPRNALPGLPFPPLSRRHVLQAAMV